MELIQKIYIFFLSPFCSVAEKADNRFKKRLIYVTCFFLFATCYIWYSVIGLGKPLTLFSRMLESIVLIAILVILGLEKPLQTQKWNKKTFYLWFALGVLIFVMGFFTDQNAGYWMTGPVIAVGLPCFYTIYGKEEKYLLIFDALCKGAIICTIVYFFVCLGGEFFNSNTWYDGRYNGLTGDANRIGELCLAAFCCVIFYILTGKRTTKWYLLSVLSLGMIIGQIYWTQSRTTIFAIFLIMIFYFVIVLKDAIALKSLIHLAKRFVPIVVALFIGLLAITVIDEVRNIHLGTSNIIDIVEAAQSTETEDAKEEEPEENQYRDLLPNKGLNLNEYSSGRLHIWTVYAREFNFIGNDADAETPISPEIGQRTAHNTLIEITYRSGYVTGSVYALLLAITGIHILKVMFRRNSRNTEGDYFMAIASIGYIIFTNLMPAYNPLTSIIFLLYVIAFPVLLGQKYIFK